MVLVKHQHAQSFRAMKPKGFPVAIAKVAGEQAFDLNVGKGFWIAV